MLNAETTKVALDPELLHKINAYWRAASYLSGGQIYLYDNPLLREPPTFAHVKPLGRTLRDDAGPELHLYVFESGRQEVRPGHVLHRRSRSRRPGDCGQRVPRGHVECGVSERHP